MEREEALKIVRENYPHFGTTEPWLDLEKALATLIPELRESEDERIRKLLVWQVHRNIEDETNDLAQSVYDGVKGHDPDIEESIEDWKRCLAYLEKHKEQKPADSMALSEDGFTPKDVFRFNLASCLYNYGKKVAAKCLDTHILDSVLNEYVTNEDVNKVVEKHIELLRRDANTQKPAEWSEEERDKVAQYLHDRDGGMLWSKATEITSDILDILRPSWKPSEEQMKALYTMVCECRPADQQLLQDIYYGLKKLM